MWRSKKFIIFTVLAAVLLVGSIGGIALAADNGDDNQPKAQCGALLDRVCEIYQQNTGATINKEALKGAFAQAASEMRPELPKNRPMIGPEAMQNRLNSLVSEGKITQEQADALQKWWDSKPDAQFEFGPQGQINEEQANALKVWRDARPDVPFGFDFPGHGKFRGMGGPPCTQAE